MDLQLNPKQAFSCSATSSGRLQIKDKDDPRPWIFGWWPKVMAHLPNSYSPSVVPDFHCSNNLTLIFALRLSDYLELMALFPLKSPRVNNSSCNDLCFCERWRTIVDVRSHLQPRCPWSRRTITITAPVTRPYWRAQRNPDGWHSHSASARVLRSDQRAQLCCCSELLYILKATEHAW